MAYQAESLKAYTTNYINFINFTKLIKDQIKLRLKEFKKYENSYYFAWETKFCWQFDRPMHTGFW